MNLFILYKLLLLCFFTLNVLCGIDNHRGFMERVMFSLIKYEALNKGINIDLLKDFDTIDKLKIGLKDYFVQFAANGDLLGSNIPLKWDGTSITYDETIITNDEAKKYTFTNIAGDSVKCYYSADETNNLFSNLETQNDASKTARLNFKNYIEGNGISHDFNIGSIKNEPDKLFGGIGLNSDMKSNYNKGYLVVSKMLNDNPSIMTENVKNIINNVVELRTEYNKLLGPRLNSLADAYIWYADLCKAESRLINGDELKKLYENTDEYKALSAKYGKKSYMDKTISGEPTSSPIKSTIETQISKDASSALDHIIVRNLGSNLANAGTSEFKSSTNAADYKDSVSEEEKPKIVTMDRTKFSTTVSYSCN